MRLLLVPAAWWEARSPRWRYAFRLTVWQLGLSVRPSREIPGGSVYVLNPAALSPSGGPLWRYL